jgi:hypothetical protein
LASLLFAGGAAAFGGARSGEAAERPTPSLSGVSEARFLSAVVTPNGSTLPFAMKDGVK